MDIISRISEWEKLQNLMQKDRERKTTPFLGQRVGLRERKAEGEEDDMGARYHRLSIPHPGLRLFESDDKKKKKD